MIKVSVSFATPTTQVEIPLEVAENTTVALAIRRSGILQQFPEIDFPNIDVGIYSHKTTLDAPLGEGDRVEIYRPLIIDPKQARLLKAKQKR